MDRNPEFTIIIDTREAKPYSFETINPMPLIEYKKLATGDYSVKGMEHLVTCERKSLADIFSSCGQGRERFQREFERLSQFRFAALVIEADLETIYRTPPSRSKIDPKNILRTIIAWHMRHNVKVWPCPTRGFAEKLTYLLLKRFADDVQSGKIIIDQPF